MSWIFKLTIENDDQYLPSSIIGGKVKKKWVGVGDYGISRRVWDDTIRDEGDDTRNEKKSCVWCQ